MPHSPYFPPTPKQRTQIPLQLSFQQFSDRYRREILDNVEFEYRDNYLTEKDINDLVKKRLCFHSHDCAR